MIFLKTKHEAPPPPDDPMASHYHHHHHNNRHTTATSTTTCCCQTPSYHPSPPPLPTDPFLLAAIVSEILQTQPQNPNPQNPLHFHSHPPKPSSDNPNQRYPHPETHQLPPHSIFSSLFERIEALEISLHHFSSLFSRPCFSLRDVAARTIQTHFRAYLVRRSRTFGLLKELARIKSCVIYLESSVSHCGFVDFDSLSHKAIDLKLQLNTIKGDDKMIRNTKRSITKEIAQLLEMIDGFCVKKQKFTARTMKNVKMVRNNHGVASLGRGLSERGVGSKCRSVNGEEKKLIANLREKVERISRMSRGLGDEGVNNEEIEGFEHVGDKDGEIIDQISNNYMLKNGLSVEKNVRGSNAKKHGCFVENGSVVWVNNVDGGTPLGINEIKDFNKGREDMEEEHSDSEQSIQSNGSHHNEDKEFTFSVPESVKMKPTAGLMMRKPGVKIVG